MNNLQTTHPVDGVSGMPYIFVSAWQHDGQALSMIETALSRTEAQAIRMAFMAMNGRVKLLDPIPVIRTEMNVLLVGVMPDESSYQNALAQLDKRMEYPDGGVAFYYQERLMCVRLGGNGTFLSMSFGGKYTYQVVGMVTAMMEIQPYA